MSERKKVQTPHAPGAIGPYSQAIVAAGLVHCSGQVALDPASGEIVGADAAQQTQQVLTNLKAVLEAAGSGLERVLKCTVYITNMDDFGAINAAYGEFFPGVEPPARATVEVSRLPKNVLVEIDCVALA